MADTRSCRAWRYAAYSQPLKSRCSIQRGRQDESGKSSSPARLSSANLADLTVPTDDVSKVHGDLQDQGLSATNPQVKYSNQEVELPLPLDHRLYKNTIKPSLKYKSVLADFHEHSKMNVFHRRSLGFTVSRNNKSQPKVQRWSLSCGSLLQLLKMVQICGMHSSFQLFTSPWLR